MGGGGGGGGGGVMPDAIDAWICPMPGSATDQPLGTKFK